MEYTVKNYNVSDPWFSLYEQQMDGRSLVSRPTPKRRKISTVMYIVMVVLMFGVFLTFVNIWELRRMQSEHMTLHTIPEADTGSPAEESKKPIVWVNGKNVRAHMTIRSDKVWEF